MNKTCENCANYKPIETAKSLYQDINKALDKANRGLIFGDVARVAKNFSVVQEKVERLGQFINEI